MKIGVPFDQRDLVKAIPGAFYTGSSGIWEVPREHLEVVGLACTPLRLDIANRLTVHQKEGVARALTDPIGHLFAWDTGLGKTYGSMAIAAQTCARRVLVVCPAIGKTHWACVANEWGYSATVLWPKATAKRERWEVFPVSGAIGLVGIVNYELLGRLTPEEQSGYDLIIADECHYLANTKEGRLELAPRRTREMFYLREQNMGAYRLALSATPAPDRSIDLWGTLEWLHPGRWGVVARPGDRLAAMQSGFWRFARFFHEVEKGEYGYVVGGVRNTEIFRQRLAAVSHAVSKRDVEMVPWSLVVERTAPVEYSPRTAILTDTRAKAKQLAKQFPDAIVFTGAETPRKRGELIAKARAEGRGIICTAHAVREAIDLTHWHVVRYAQVPWALLPFVQSMGRFHRLSSTAPVKYCVHVAGPFEAEKAERICAKAREIRSIMPKGLEVDEWLATQYSHAEIDQEIAEIDMSGVDSADGEW